MPLPENYTQVDHIIVNGSFIIDTGYKCVDTTKIEIKVSFTDTTHNMPLFGSRNAVGDCEFTLWLDQYNASSPKTCFVWGSNKASAIGDTVTGIDLGTPAVYTACSDGLYIDGTLVQSVSKSGTVNSGYNLMLLGLNTGGTIDSRSFYGKFYNAKIYESDTLVKEYVPYVNTTDGIFGVYETIGGTFYASSNRTFIVNSGKYPYLAGTHLIEVFSKPLPIGIWQSDNCYPYFPRTRDVVDVFLKPLPTGIYTQNSGKYPTYAGVEPVHIGAFTYAVNLKSVIIPRSVKYIGEFAFTNTKLSEVTISRDCKYYSTSFPTGCTIKFYE